MLFHIPGGVFAPESSGKIGCMDCQLIVYACVVWRSDRYEDMICLQLMSHHVAVSSELDVG